MIMSETEAYDDVPLERQEVGMSHDGKQQRLSERNRSLHSMASLCQERRKSMAQLFTFIILLATSASLVMYLACALAALWLLHRGKMKGTPIFALIAILAAAYAVWTLVGAGLEATGWGAVLLLAGLPVYWIMRPRTKA